MFQDLDNAIEIHGDGIGVHLDQNGSQLGIIAGFQAQDNGLAAVFMILVKSNWGMDRLSLKKWGRLWVFLGQLAIP